MFSELWSETRYRLRRLFNRAQVDQELDDEVRFHLEREAEKLERDGASKERALRDARVAFGGVSRIKDDTRDAHGTALLEQFLQDIVYAFRGLRARPLFTLVVIATLGLGVGVNAAMFGVLDRAFFRPPAYLRAPSTVRRVFVTWTGRDGDRGPQGALEYARYLDFAATTRTTSAVAAFATRTLAVGEGDDSRELPIAAMSANVFELFDAWPTIGRFFEASEDDAPAGMPVAVLSYGFWSSHFSSRQGVLGTMLRIGKTTYSIVGVAPPNFRAFSELEAPVAFIPITRAAVDVNKRFATTYEWSWLNVYIRNKPGVTNAESSADLSNAFRLSWQKERGLQPSLPSLETAKPEAFAAPIQRARGPSAGPEARVMKWVAGVAFIVLIVACANVANLLLARSLRRRREIAVRRALGGSRARITRQLLTETLTLSLLGGIAGLVAARATASAFQKLLFPFDDAMSSFFDARTIGIALVLTLLSAMMAGLVPALHAGRDDLADSLRGGMREGAYRHSRARTTLLVFQTSLSVLLLVGAGLFVRSLQAVGAVRLGYDVDPIVFVQYTERGVQLSDGATAALGDRMVAEARTIPGVVDATLNVSAPFYSTEARWLGVDGVDSLRQLGRFQLQAGSPDYFAVTGTRILRGRGFTSDDRASTPRIVVVSESMGRVLWKGADPIGKCIRVGSDTMPCTTVVGVAENMRAEQITDGGEFAYYLPMEQYRVVFGSTPPSLYVRVNGRSDDYVEAVRSHLQRLVTSPAYVTTIPFHEMIDPTRRSWQAGATMFVAFGGLALALAALGLYAVVAFSVSQRTPELGVRIALGALPSDVIRLVVGEGLRVTIVGVAIGGAVALIASRSVAPLLYGVSPRDPVVFSVVVLVLVAVGVVASMVPAMRAAKVDPNIALRIE